MSTDVMPEVLLCDEVTKKALPRDHPFRVYRKATKSVAEHAQNLIVLCSAMHLRDISGLVTEVNRRHSLRALFVREDAGASWLPQMLSRANLRAVRNMFVHSDHVVPRRVMRAWQLGAQEHLVANATVADGSLFVVSCEPETYEIRFDQMPALRALPIKERPDLEIADDGSYIHWPKSDVHIDLDAVRSVIDDQWRARTAAERLRRDGNYGAAIAALREERQLRQRDIAGLSERQVRRIEQGEGISTRALTALATAHGLSLADYLDQVAAKAHSLGRRSPSK